MLSKYIIEKYGYKWDDNWSDTNNILSVMNTMSSLDEDLVKVAQDCLDYLKESKSKLRAVRITITYDGVGKTLKQANADVWNTISNDKALQLAKID